MLTTSAPVERQYCQCSLKLKTDNSQVMAALKKHNKLHVRDSIGEHNKLSDQMD